MIKKTYTLSNIINAAAITTVRYKEYDYAIIVGGSEGNTVRKNVISVFYDARLNSITAYTNTNGLAEARDSIAATTISVNGKDYAVFVGGWISGTAYSKYIDVITKTDYNTPPTTVVS